VDDETVRETFSLATCKYTC